MLTTSTGKQVKYYLGEYHTPGNIAFSFVETTDDKIEFYFTTKRISEIETKVKPYLIIDRDFNKSTYTQKENILKACLKDTNIEPEIREAFFAWL